MEEVENIKKLLLSDDSKELGLGVRVATLNGLTGKVLDSLNKDVINFIESKYSLTVKFWVFHKENKSRFRLAFLSCSIIELKNITDTKIFDDIELFNYAEKRQDTIDLIKELSK